MPIRRFQTGKTDRRWDAAIWGLDGRFIARRTVGIESSTVAPFGHVEELLGGGRRAGRIGSRLRAGTNGRPEIRPALLAQIIRGAARIHG